MQQFKYVGVCMLVPTTLSDPTSIAGSKFLYPTNIVKKTKPIHTRVWITWLISSSSCSQCVWCWREWSYPSYTGRQETHTRTHTHKHLHTHMSALRFCFLGWGSWPRTTSGLFCISKLHLSLCLSLSLSFCLSLPLFSPFPFCPSLTFCSSWWEQNELIRLSGFK